MGKLLGMCVVAFAVVTAGWAQAGAPKKITSQCAEASCREIAKVAEQIASEPGRMRTGEFIECALVGCTGEAYQVDLANEGKSLIMAVWYKGPWNPWLFFYRPQANGKFEEIDPRQWHGYDKIDKIGLSAPVLGHTFVPFGGKNYWVVTQEKSKRLRVLSLFLLEQGVVRSVGTITVQSR